MPDLISEKIEVHNKTVAVKAPVLLSDITPQQYVHGKQYSSKTTDGAGASLHCRSAACTEKRAFRLASTTNTRTQIPPGRH